MTKLGVIFPPDRPPEELREVALAADEAGLDQLWLWEDCFYESGVATAAAVLAWTTRVQVGIGLLPVPLRNVALTAMELTTLARLFPGRVVPGVGHGVLDWMDQVGARAASPMTLLREYTASLRDLLHGQTVTRDGSYVHLRDVALDWPPVEVPPVLVGAVGPKTLRLAGELGDGVILTGETTVEALGTALGEVRTGGAGNDFDVVVFVPVESGTSAADIAARVGEYVAAGATTVALLEVGDDLPSPAGFARFVGSEVSPLLG